MSLTGGSKMRGLTNFIKEIKECPDKQSERERVKLELAKFKQVFNNAKSMGSYQRKKYVCKILYIFMLGYRVDIGRTEAVQLCGAKKFSEKQVGYLAVGVLIHDGHELLGRLIHTLQKDIESSNYEIQALAVTCIANIGGRHLAQKFGDCIVNILMSQNSTTQLKKKASICLLRLMRENPDIVKPEFMHIKLQQLLGMYHLGLLTSVMSLLLGLTKLSLGTDEFNQYQVYVPRVIEILTQMIVTYVSSSKMSHYEYFGVPNPWLQINLLRFLKYFPIPENEKQQALYEDVIRKILFEKISNSEGPRYITAKNAILLETFDLVIKLKTQKELKQAMFHLSQFMSSESLSLQLIAIEKLHHMLQVCPEMIVFAAPHFKKIFSLIEVADRLSKVYIIEVMFILCASEYTNDIIQGLLGLLTQQDPEMTPTISEKLLILANRGCKSTPQWYVEIMIRILSLSGDLVSENDTQTFIEIVNNNQDIQAFAIKNLIQFGMDPKSNPSNTYSHVCAILIPKYGTIISNEQGTSPVEQFKVIVSNYGNCNDLVKNEIKEALKYLYYSYSDIKPTIEAFSENLSLNIDFNSKCSIDISKPPITETISIPEVNKDINEAKQSNIDISKSNIEEKSPYDFPNTDEFKALIFCSQGVLVQNEFLQIGLIREQISANQVKITLYYGNISSVNISNIDVSVNNPDMNAILFEADQPPLQINTQQQIPQSVIITCAKEFIGAAQMNITFSTPDENIHHLTSHLPAIIISFTTGYIVSGQDFLVAWNQINGDPLETQIMWKTSISLDINRAKDIFINKLHFALIDGVDDNPINLVASCVFNTNTQKIPVLCRLESDPGTQMFRITTKCFSPILSLSISKVVRYFIS